MPERTYPAKVVIIEYECDEDGCTGTLEATSGGTRTSKPPQYPHECTECGKKQYFTGKTYPSREFRRADEPTYD